MGYKTLYNCALLAVTFSLVSVRYAQAAPVTKLKMNGKIASTQVKVIGGVAYVPVSDVAKAMGQKVVPMPGGLEIKVPTGTMQAGKLSGKIGDVIQTQKYSFQVLSIQSVDSYPSKYMPVPETIKPDNENETLYIVNCSLKNTLPKAQGPVHSPSYARNTALTDYDGQSYAPAEYDSRLRGNFSGSSMLPGSKVIFALVFRVPKSAKLKDLVFTVSDYFDPEFNGPDVRISLN